MYIRYRRDYLSKLYSVPLSLLSIIFLLSITGILALYSAADGSMTPWASRQLLNLAIFMPVSILTALVDIKLIYKFAYFFYFLILSALIGVELFGTLAMGGKRWIDLGFTRVQPSEPAKLAIVLMLARYFNDIKYESCNNPLKLLIALLGVAAPVALIIKQPDLGTGIITILVASIIFFAIGVKIWKFCALGVTLLCALPIIWNCMYEYQRNRVLMFLDPNRDPLGAGYNIIQSEIAIGSGGLFGKGWLLGSQSHLSFLPEHQTDFIFSSFAEEFGLSGGIWLLILYAILTLMGLTISTNAKSLFGKLITVGITSIFFCHVFINMSMVTGLLPAVGVPLPFMSYGGTMTASMLIGFGIVMNVCVNRHTKI